MQYNSFMRIVVRRITLIPSVIVFLILTILLAVSGCYSPEQGKYTAPAEQPSESSLSEDAALHEETAGPFRPDPSHLQDAQVLEIIDGDTVRVRLDGVVYKLRLIGVNSPELNHPTRGEEPFAVAARKYTHQNLNGQTVQLEFDVEKTDQYGRLLAYVWLGGEMFNEVLLREGYAQLVTFPPNVKYVDFFRSAQRSAIEAERGLWREPGGVSTSAGSKGTFVGSSSSNKYHFPECDWAKQIPRSRQIWFISRSEAALAEYEPCGTCSP